MAKAESIQSVWTLYEAVLDALEEIISATSTNAEFRSQAVGIIKKVMMLD